MPVDMLGWSYTTDLANGEKHCEKQAKNINEMQATGQYSSFLVYTRELTDKVNRGGLYVINDEGFYRFLAITRNTTYSFKVQNAFDWQKKEIIEHVCKDCDVHFHWRVLSVLLKHILNTIWVTPSQRRWRSISVQLGR